VFVGVRVLAAGVVAVADAELVAIEPRSCRYWFSLSVAPAQSPRPVAWYSSASISSSRWSTGLVRPPPASVPCVR